VVTPDDAGQHPAKVGNVPSGGRDKKPRMSVAAAAELGVWPHPEPEFLTRPEAAALARKSTDTIARWQREGKLGKYGTDARPLIRTEELRHLLYRDGEQ